MGPLKEEVTNRLPWLLRDLGFYVTFHDYSYKEMGGSVVELESDSLRLRFVRDRGPIYVEVASLSEPERWFELRALWAILTGQSADPELEGWGWFIRDHFAQLVEAFGPNFPHAIQEFERRQREARESLERRYPRPGLLRRFVALRYTTTAGALLMGPAGWVIAAMLILWETLVR
jgi:hypothetical protein